ncbi:MAG: hypothetical protein AAGA48_01755 [Myxococcota bacterium]
MIVLFSTALAAPIVIDVPFPTERLFDKPDRVCVELPSTLPNSFSQSEMEEFTLGCEVRDGMLFACVTLNTKQWPDQVPPLSCGPPEATVRIRPVAAFDPSETIWNGVSLVRNVSVLQAAYRVNHPDAAGILPAGRCAIEDGKFWFKTLNPAARQTCTLVIGEMERSIPIRLVRKLPKR